MTPAPFVSFAQNGEDVVLWRALHSVGVGRYVEVGANHPRDDSATRAFYDRGWSGITVEPVPYFAELQRTARPRDRLVEAAVSNDGPGEITLHVLPGTGLSTIVDSVRDRHAVAGFDPVDLVVPTVRLDDLLAEHGSPDDEIHFMLIDVEGAESEVLKSVDLRRWRPWVLVVESTAPNSTDSTHGEWEPDLLASGYEYCLFDGVSRFYVADERADLLRSALSYPACVLDNFISLRYQTALQEKADLLTQLIHWRRVALTSWADAVSQSTSTWRSPTSDSTALDRANDELEAIRGTVSWRLTRPIRGVRTMLDRVRSR